MKASDLPVNDEYDFGLDDWACVLNLGNDAPSTWRRYAEIDTMATAVITQEDKGEITVDRIESVEAFYVDSPEGYASTNLYALVKLTDGWATVMAWCDTSGWDCRSDGQWKWAASREEAIANGLGKEERSALGLALPNELENPR